MESKKIVIYKLHQQKGYIMNFTQWMEAKINPHQWQQYYGDKPQPDIELGEREPDPDVYPDPGYHAAKVDGEEVGEVHAAFDMGLTRASRRLFKDHVGPNDSVWRLFGIGLYDDKHHGKGYGRSMWFDVLKMVAKQETPKKKCWLGNSQLGFDGMHRKNSAVWSLKTLEKKGLIEYYDIRLGGQFIARLTDDGRRFVGLPSLKYSNFPV